jgi:hypothetical protein
MGITLDDGERKVGTPVVKRQRIGDKFVGAIIRYEQRDRTKVVDGVRTPVLKPNGKPRQELVVHCLALPENTAAAGIGDDTRIPEVGEQVRLILNGKAFGDWIEARKAHRNGAVRVGDVVIQRVTHAQAYDANGNPKGGELTTQAEADGVPRGTSLGFYGPVTLHEPKDDKWVTAAEQAYRSATAIDAGAPAASTATVTDEEPW